MRRHNRAEAPGPSMTLGNMRRLGVRRLNDVCGTLEQG
jgi:hypothetical protein